MRKVILVLIALVSMPLLNLSATELSSQQIAIDSLPVGSEGEAFFDSSIVETNPGAALRNINYFFYHNDQWVSPLNLTQSPNMETQGEVLFSPNISFIDSSTEVIDGVEYYTFNYADDYGNHSPDYSVVLHVEGTELFVDTTLTNNTLKSLSPTVDNAFGLCMSSVSKPYCNTSESVQVYSQGSGNGIYFNAQPLDVNFHLNFLGTEKPWFTIYNQFTDDDFFTNPDLIDSDEGELLYDGQEAGIWFDYATELEPGESTTFSYSLGMSAGDFGPNTVPEISFENNQSTDEEDELSDNQLQSLFSVTAIDAEDGDLTDSVYVDDLAVDYHTPGVYDVDFSVTDNDGNTTTETAQLEIIDLLPVIDLRFDNETIKLGETIEDYVDKYEVMASESYDDDLTDQIVVDDSAINYNSTGNYEIVFSVSDEEGNSASDTANLRIVRDLDIPVTSDVTPEASVILLDALETASSVEEQVLSDQALISLFEVTTNVDEAIKVDQTAVDYTTPGNYQVIFSLESGKQQTATLSIEDKLPTIETNKDTYSIDLGTTNLDYLQVYGVSATEINTGDLTQVISIDDSGVDYNNPGVYSVIFTVSDNEGNTVSKTVSLTITEVDMIDNSEDDNPTDDKTDLSINDDADEEESIQMMVKDEENQLENTGSQIVRVVLVLTFVVMGLLLVKRSIQNN